MNPILLKSLIGVGVIGGSTGLAIGGHYLFKSSEPTTLLEKFKKKNITILDYGTENTHESDWNAKLNKYKQNETTNKFTDLTITSSDTDNGLQKLKEKCKEILGKPISETKNLESKAKEWCTNATSPSS